MVIELEVPVHQGDFKGGKKANDNFNVGYGKPPRHTRFARGQSGNPRGRKKGVRNLASDVKRTLEAPVKLTEKGRRKQVSTQEAALMRLKDKALKGDPRALDRLLALAGAFNNSSESDASGADLAAEDQAILDAYAEEILGQPRLLKPAGIASNHRDGDD
jgi:hypothetical protein